MMSSSVYVSIPQAVWIACNGYGLPLSNVQWAFQYRKRYGLHAMTIRLAENVKDVGFQYRKRYGLHAMGTVYLSATFSGRFNTASGMDCMQFYPVLNTAVAEDVSIPQAVWIACNKLLKKTLQQVEPFQYRKRYGLHAIL